MYSSSTTLVTSSDELPRFSIDMEKTVVDNLMKREGSWRPYGNYRAFCNGKILIGPIRSWWWVLEIAMIILTITLIIEYEKYNLWVWITGLLQAVVVMASSFKALLINPGVLKKPPFSEALENAKDAAERVSPGTMYGARRSIYDDIKGYRVRQHYCFRCHLWRPQNAKHCYVCGCCQTNFHHHCPVVGICVAGTNILAFTVMTVSICIYIIYLISASLSSGYQWYSEGKVKHILLASFVTDELVVFIVLGIIIVPILANLPCEAEKHDPPPDNRPRRSVIVQLLEAQGRRKLNFLENGEIDA